MTHRTSHHAGGVGAQCVRYAVVVMIFMGWTKIQMKGGGHGLVEPPRIRGCGGQGTGRLQEAQNGGHPDSRVHCALVPAAQRWVGCNTFMMECLAFRAW
eukprot:CAMPEP_0174360000 /NCGR_PEP_ID=MMETSP0811_2-20130205/51627_1 /TAXON_ID=73025 ORGANISM="Eutreptiella gymnastica-like, Strain CCMP1594" /NCGR_SAMPLE_ID=MMETSP0811_2 /ASSEMBLY_ACC=CAM_ASM_000667 /LENGTH=98 /DNA_ID=CAMNT_0015495221 /DNA_START=397 /DNA_END=690 /DNA_ORIENTATION=-